MAIDKKKLAAEQRLLNAPRYQQERPFIIDCLRRLRRAQTPRNYYELHRALLLRFGAHQAILDADMRAVEAEHGERLQRLVRERPKPIEQIREVQEALDRVKRERAVSNAILHAFRIVGDGIAWKVLGYDRAALAVLGNGTRVGRLAPSSGRDEELAQLGRLWEEDGVSRS